MLEPCVSDGKKTEFRKELSKFQKQIEDYRKGHLNLRLDNLIKKLEMEDNRSWFNYYHKKEDIE